MRGRRQGLLRQSRYFGPQGGRRVDLQRRAQGLRQVIVALFLSVLALDCSPSVLALREELRGPAMRQDALELSDKLEELIDEQKDTHEDRAEAYEIARDWPQKTAAYAYGRAVLAGRLAQIRGL